MPHKDKSVGWKQSPVSSQLISYPSGNCCGLNPPKLPSKTNGGVIARGRLIIPIAPHHHRPAWQQVRGGYTVGANTPQRTPPLGFIVMHAPLEFGLRLSVQYYLSSAQFHVSNVPTYIGISRTWD